jgi:hypothetical protein
LLCCLLCLLSRLLSVLSLLCRLLSVLRLLHRLMSVLSLVLCCLHTLRGLLRLLYGMLRVLCRVLRLLCCLLPQLQQLLLPLLCGLTLSLPLALVGQLLLLTGLQRMGEQRSAAPADKLAAPSRFELQGPALWVCMRVCRGLGDPGDP